MSRISEKWVCDKCSHEFDPYGGDIQYGKRGYCTFMEFKVSKGRALLSKAIINDDRSLEIRIFTDDDYDLCGECALKYFKTKAKELVKLFSDMPGVQVMGAEADNEMS